MDYSQIAHTFSNGITVVNTTPHPITFQNPEGGIDIIPSSVQEGEKTGYAVVNATPVEKEYAPHVVDTTFEGNEQGQKIIDEIKSQFAEAEKAGNLMIIGSMVAANAYPDIKGMCPAPGFERVPPAEKRMSCEKFTQGEAKKEDVNKDIEQASKEETIYAVEFKTYYDDTPYLTYEYFTGPDAKSLAEQYKELHPMEECSVKEIHSNKNISLDEISKYSEDRFKGMILEERKLIETAEKAGLDPNEYIDVLKNIEDKPLYVQQQMCHVLIESIEKGDNSLQYAKTGFGPKTIETINTGIEKGFDESFLVNDSTIALINAKYIKGFEDSHISEVIESCIYYKEQGYPDDIIETAKKECAKVYYGSRGAWIPAGFKVPDPIYATIESFDSISQYIEKQNPDLNKEEIESITGQLIEKLVETKNIEDIRTEIKRKSIDVFMESSLDENSILGAEKNNVCNQIISFIQNVCPDKDISKEAMYIAQNYGEKFLTASNEEKIQILQECIQSNRDKKAIDVGKEPDKSIKKEKDINDSFDEI